jgi:hypothetical protein
MLLCVLMASIVWVSYGTVPRRRVIRQKVAE